MTPGTPRSPPPWRRYLRFWGPDVDADIDDELRFHVEMREREFLAAGLPPAAAREAALARFGDVGRVTKALRAHDTRRQRRERREETMNQLAQDLRYAVRTLAKSPGFTAAVVMVLALGIGAATAIFGVVDAALLRPLPYPGAARLVAVSDVQEGGLEAPASFPEYLDWKGDTSLFSELAAYSSNELTLTGGDEPELLQGARVSANLAAMLGASPAVGRAFRPDEEPPSGERVVMLGDDLWRRRFHADRSVIGRTLTLSGLPFTVVGIVPPGPRSLLPDHLAAPPFRVDFWMPLRLDAEQAPRGLHFLSVVGRLRPGIEPRQADARLAALSKRLRDAGVTRHAAVLAPLDRRVVGSARPLLMLLLAAVGMLLLIACANAANLLLARGATRRRELALRSALGASRERILAQLLVESAALAAAGGALGVLLAWAGLHALRALRPESLPRVGEAALDGRILAFTVALSLATGVLFGLAPALRAARGGLAEVLRGGGRGASGAVVRDRLRSSLVVAEVSLSFALLVGAGLLARSFDRLLAVDKGFDAARVLSAELNLPDTKYGEPLQQVEFFRRVREHAAAIPGVVATALVSQLPTEGYTNGDFAIEGRPFPPDAGPLVDKRIASDGYFAVMRTPVLEGRAFDSRDAARAPAVIVVNRSFARRYFPNQSPLGRRVDFLWGTKGMQEIVGVVADLREHGLHEPAEPAMYIPFAQRPASSMQLLVRTGGADPTAILPALRSAVLAVDREQPIARVRTLEEVVDRGLAGRRFSMSLVGAFSAAALLLAAVGLYAVVSYSVAQRTQEIGIRVALGARRAEIMRVVLRQGMSLIAAGIVVGGALALALGRFLRGLLFGVGASDPATFAAVALVLAALTLLASYAPAARAARVDPMVTLRSD